MMDLNSCISLIQTYLTEVPLIVLGSGASAAYGLPTMFDLSNEILKHESCFDKSDESIQDFFYNLKKGCDLETAIRGNHQLNESSEKLIRKIVWDCINSKDLEFFENGLKTDFTDFALVDLIKNVISPTPYNANIITTNYDRLAEYAADILGASIVTGFEGAYLKKMEFPSEIVKNKRLKIRERTVSIWKVHGSLDWFISSNGQQFALTRADKIIDSFYPCIVPPGNNKYMETHLEPYRSIIAQADNAITNARSFLVIGYGFNDDHIQPKIIQEIKKGKPIVVLTKAATASCKQLLKTNNIQKYVIIEERDGKTLVSTKDGESEFDEDFWSLKNFLNKW